FFQAEDGIRDYKVTGVQTCALPISDPGCQPGPSTRRRRGARLPVRRLRPASARAAAIPRYWRVLAPAATPRTASALAPQRRKARGRRARSASAAELHDPHAFPAEMAGEDLVVVVVEARARAGLQQLGELIIGARRPEIAPLVHHVHLGSVAFRVALDDAERAAMPPLRRPQLDQFTRQARMVLMDSLLAGAHARAAADLMAKARSLARRVEAQRLQAKPVLVGDRP